MTTLKESITESIITEKIIDLLEFTDLYEEYENMNINDPEEIRGLIRDTIDRMAYYTALDGRDTPDECLMSVVDETLKAIGDKPGSMAQYATRLIYDYTIEERDVFDISEDLEEFTALMNILKVHGENIDSLKWGGAVEEKSFCGIDHNAETVAELVAVLFEFNMYMSYEELKQYLIGKCENDPETFDINNYDIRPAYDGYVVVLHY